MKKVNEMVKELNLIPDKEEVRTHELKDKAKYVTLLGKKYQTYYEDSRGYWWESKYEIIGNKVKEIYYGDFSGYWWKSKNEIINDKVIEVYFEDSDGDERWYDSKDILDFTNGNYSLNGKKIDKNKGKIENFRSKNK